MLKWGDSRTAPPLLKPKDDIKIDAKTVSTRSATYTPALHPSVDVFNVRKRECLLKKCVFWSIETE